ncbi:MAG: ComF family protein [Bacteroidaceae bacterium]|nr:ComF family protein [Bacteroidaceae bacterium]
MPRTAYSRNTKRNEVKNLFELKIPIERAGSFMRYLPNERSASIIKNMKYSHNYGLARMMGRMMAEEFSQPNSDFFADIDVIIPAPLTKKRNTERGYNQAEELARGIVQVVDKQIDTTSVIRRIFKASQTTLSREERTKNVQDAFDCIHPEQLSGKHILLVDDVITTGATLLSLADSILEKTDNVRFSVLSLAITGDLKYN